MRKAGVIQQFRDYMIRLLGLLVAPIIFSVAVCGIALLIANVTVGDIVGYGSVLLLDTATEDHEITDFLIPVVEPNTDNTSSENTVDIRDIDFPKYEQPYGELSIPSIDVLCPFIYGDTDKALKKGVCQYIGSNIIGYGGTTLACAHVNRQLKNLHKIQLGDLIQVRTTYGVYTYEVKYAGVHDASDDSIYDLGREDENLVLYTCYYQKTALGSVKKRFFACADYVSGPMIVDRGH